MKNLVVKVISFVMAFGFAMNAYAMTLAPGAGALIIQNPNGNQVFEAIVNQSGYNLVFQYTGAAIAGGSGFPNGAALALTIPNEFPMPSTQSTSPGYVKVTTVGAVVLANTTPTINGRTIIVYISSFGGAATDRIEINYGNGNLKMPSVATTYNFPMAIKTINSTKGYPDGFEALPSIPINVKYVNATGSITPNPTALIANQSGYNLDLIITYNGAAILGDGSLPDDVGLGSPNGIAVAVTIPNDFPLPSLNSTDPGYVTVDTNGSGATLQPDPQTPSIINSKTVVAFINQIATNQQIRFRYGNGNLKLPNKTGKFCFNMEFRPIDMLPPPGTNEGYPSGFQPVTPSPCIVISSSSTSSGGQSTVQIQNPIGILANAIVRQSGYNLRFTYNYTDANPILGGSGAPNGVGYAIVIPNDFPVPSLNPTDPGYVTTSTPGATLAIVNGRTVIAFVTSISTGGQIVIDYGNGNLTMPNRPNKYTFNSYFKNQNTNMGYPSGFQMKMPSPQVNVLTNMLPASVILTPSTARANCDLEMLIQLGAGEQRSLFKGDRVRVWFDWDPNALKTIGSATAVTPEISSPATTNIAIAGNTVDVVNPDGFIFGRQIRIQGTFPYPDEIATIIGILGNTITFDIGTPGPPIGVINPHNMPFTITQISTGINEFPSENYIGLRVPMNLQKEYVKINGMQSIVNPSVQYHTYGGGLRTAIVDFYLPSDIRCTTTTGQVIKIKIDKASGLRNGDGDPFASYNNQYTRRALVSTINSNGYTWIEPDVTGTTPSRIYQNPGTSIIPPDPSWMLFSNNYSITTQLNANTSSPPIVIPSTSTTGQISEYIIGASGCGLLGSFVIGGNGALTANTDTISIEFPAGTEVPKSINPASISVAVFPPGIPPWNIVNYPPQISGNIVTFKVPVNIQSGNCISVKFDQSAKIVNPTVGGDYFTNVWTSKETTKVSTLNYQIENPGWAVVNVTPNQSFSDGTSVVVSSAGECFKYGSNDADTTGAKYTIQFSLSESCRITQNVTQINIQFDSVYGSAGLLPLAFVAPPGAAGTPPINSVLVNNIACNIVGNVIVNPGTSTISIISPVDIAPGSQVTVVFQPNAQIENPDIDEETENFVIRIAIPGCQPEIISQSYFIKTEVSNVNLVNFYPGAPPLQPQNFVPAVNSISPWIIDFCLGDYGNGGINVPNLLPGDTISVTFPEGTTIPAAINTNGVYLYIGRPAPGGQQVQLINARVDGNKITAQLPSILPAPGMIFENERLTIVFPDTLQIKTPPTAGSYFVTVQTSKETTPVQSSYFMIGTVVVKDSVVVSPNTSSSVGDTCTPGYSEYTIRFRTGQYGSLMPSTDFINVIFPLGFTVPGAFPFDSVILNGVSVPGPSIITFPAPFPYTGTLVQIPVQNFMSAGSLVEITFLPIANIRNPFITQNPSLYTFKMNTTAEPAWIESNPFEIISKICMGCASTVPYNSVHFAGGDSTLTSTSIMMGDVDGWLVGFLPGDMGTFVAGSTTVTVEFPPGTVVPSLIPSQYIRCFNSATLPGLVAAGAVCTAGSPAVYATVSGQKVTLMFPDIGVVPSSTVPAYVYFCEEANIQAPMVPGNYSVKAWTSREPTPVESCQFSVQARGMAPAKVVAEPSTAGAMNVKYTITLQTGPFGAIGIGDTIKVDFGDYAGTAAYLTNIAPPGFSGNLIPAMYVTVNGKECMLPVRYQPFNVGPPMSGLSFYIPSPVAVAAGGTVKIVFSPNCRITNPTAWSPDGRSPNYYLQEPLAPNYKVRISTNKEIVPVESEEYEITRPDATTRPVITNSPCVAGLSSVYNILFVTPVPLYFVAATPLTASWIEIEFPEGFYLPSSMLAEQVMVNEYKLAVPPIINNYTVTIRTPTPIPAWGAVNIKFDSSLMLKNPNLAGKYIIRTRVDGASQYISGEYTVCEQINISRIDVTPSGPISMPLGTLQQFNVKIIDTLGQVITENLEVNWQILIGQKTGYVFPVRGLQTTFTAFAQGTCVLEVLAKHGDSAPMSASVNITVTGKASSLIINPSATSTLYKNQCKTFCAQLYDNSAPPNPILSGVTYSWEITNPLGSISPKDGKCTNFCPTIDGAAEIVCTATYESEVFSAKSQLIIKTGINTLAPLPASELGALRATQLSPDLSFELRNDMNQPVSAPDTINVTVECTSPTGRFSLDRIKWMETNKISLQIVKGFSKTQSFFFADSTPGNVTITATAVNINSTTIKAVITSPTSRILFTNESRITSAGAPSPPLTLAVKDDFGQNSPPASDTIIALAAYRIDPNNGQESATPSSTGTFSLSDTAWSPLPSGTITMRAGQPTIDFFYKDLVTGKYLIKATTTFHGMAAQQITVTTAGSVGGNLIVSVDPATAKLPARYIVDFRVGASGMLGLGIGHIYLQFPSGTEIPGLSQAEVKVNGTPCQVIPIIDRTKNVMDIVTPVEIRPNTDVKVEIPRLTNPPEGTYTLIIWTSAETQPTTSVPYVIGVSTVQRLRVKVVPNSVGLEATYLIEFRTGPSGVINVNGNITIQFPVGTILPAIVEARYVKINGVLCMRSPTTSGLQMTIANPMAIQADSDVSIEIDAKAGVRNPPIPKNDYTLKLATTSDAKMVDSQPYEIVAASTVTNVKINVQPPTVSEKAKYSITFNIGANGSLFPGDEIYIQMNEQTLPTSIAALYVSVNGINPPTDPVIDGKRIKIKLSAGIAAGQQVTVTIEAAGGIKNPPNPGSDYRISVFTNKEPYPVNSEPFTLESSIIVEHTLDPSVPNGERSWYTVAPTVSLKMNGSGQIKYKYEGEQIYTTTYTGPFKVEKTGQVVIYYKGISQSGVESAEKMIVIKIDPTPPSIRISSPADTPDCTKVKEQAVSIMGTINDINDVELMMNGQSVPVRSGVFSVTVTLIPGTNKFNFIAKDFAGNQSTKVVCIELRNKPPVLSFDEPSFMAKITGIEFPDIGNNQHQLKMKLRVKGTTEPGITQVSVTPVTVPGATQTIPVTPDGRFDKELIFDAIAGLNELNAEATDSLGNKATVKLMPVLYVDFKLPINNTTANLNGLPVTLLSPPYIVNSRTMVPFRIMAESLGAKVGYDANQRMVTFELGTTTINLWIGKNTASVTVGGVTKTVKLDAVPVIKNGSTMVPFRFVAENLGAKVTWIAASKTAQMTYP